MNSLLIRSLVNRFRLTTIPSPGTGVNCSFCSAVIRFGVRQGGRSWRFGLRVNLASKRSYKTLGRRRERPVRSLEKADLSAQGGLADRNPHNLSTDLVTSRLRENRNP